MTSDNFNYADGIAEGTGSGTISPQTLPSSTDDNFHADEAWPQFQLFNSVAANMAMEAPLLQSFGKTVPPSDRAVIVEDMGEMHGQGFHDPAAEALMYQQMPSTFQMMPEQWSEIPQNINAENVPAPPPVSAPMVSNTTKNQTMGDFQTSPATYWQHDVEPQVPAAQASPASLITQQSQVQHPQESLQFKSENSSVSGDVSGIYECSYSATSEDPSVFAEHQLDDGPDWKIDFSESNSPEATSGGKTTAFMVSETPSESLLSTVPARSKSLSQRSGRPMPLAVQSTGAVRKRKNRNAQGSIDHGLSQPLQIVQEDGQGGSIASADFVSPPRGARRKGPLSMVGRANAGLRRKNKDTCVQCRLNKRKVS